MVKNKRLIWKFIIGFVLLWSFFIVVPFFHSLIMSMQSCRGSVCEFVGLGNLKKLFHDPIFWTALSNTFIYLVMQVPIMLFLALIYATILNDPKLKGRKIYRILIYIPAITSLVAYSVIFKLLFSTDGLINDVLMNLSLINQPIGWLTDPVLAKLVIILGLTWRWTGYNMIFYLSAMQNIPQETYEAAKIDGANSITTFFKITIPQLKPIIYFTAIMSTIGTLQIFDEVMNITNGGPGYATYSVSQYIYNISFVSDIDFGYAATVSYVLVIIIVILQLIQKKVVKE